MSYKKIETTPEVWNAIRKAHPDLGVYSSFSNPDGRAFGGAGEEGLMQTAYGFPESSDYPILAAETRWEIDSDKPYERINERHKYWLCVGVDES